MKLHEGDFYLDEDGDFAVEFGGAVFGHFKNHFAALFTPLEDGTAKEYLVPKEFTE